MQKKHQANIESGKIDLEYEGQFKKHSNYCNKLTKKAVRERTGQNITTESTSQDIWKSINDIMRPDRLVRSKIKIEVSTQGNHLRCSKCDKDFISQKNAENTYNYEPCDKEIHDAEVMTEPEEVHTDDQPSLAQHVRRSLQIQVI